MRLNTLKGVLACILLVLIIAGIFPTAIFANNSSVVKEEITVSIISFMRGEQSDIRSSELLMAQVSGYEGNVEELTYEWTNALGTYLYVYNSHNMYGIDKTPGEIEIYNSNVSSSSNMSGRSYKDKFSGVGFAWASVYGAYKSSNVKTALNGYISVTVKDADGNVLGTDRIDGKTASKGIVAHNLDSDLDYITIGIFEGEEHNAKNLLGNGSIVHITCGESSVTSANIIDGEGHISLRKSGSDYYIKGLVAGMSNSQNADAQVSIKVTKNNCKFHQYTSGTAITPVFVFRKPTTKTTATTLTLTGDIDPRCEFYIEGKQGEIQKDGTVLFSDLTPNTKYTVEVRGKYYDENGLARYAYAYVEDTTKPVYDISVYTYLNGVLTDLDKIKTIENQNIFIKQDVAYSEGIKLEHCEEGKYSSSVNVGEYYVWYNDGNQDVCIQDQKLIIDKDNKEAELHFYSVIYDTNGGSFNDGKADTDNYYNGSSVNGTTNIPHKDGYVFVGWELNGKVYAPGEQIAENINRPLNLVAVWEELIDIKINVTINHGNIDGYDKNSAKDELVVELLSKQNNSFIYADKFISFNKHGIQGFDYVPTYGSGQLADEVLITKYVANSSTFIDMSSSCDYSASAVKAGYDTVITPTKNENGDWVIDIVLTYNPDIFQLDFTVKMDDTVPTELYPDAVIIKVMQYNQNGWELISNHTGDLPGIQVNINRNNGEGSGSCAVNKYQFDGTTPSGNRIVIESYIYGDKVIPASDINGNYSAFTDGKCTGTIADIVNGNTYDNLLGAYYDGSTNRQQGILHADITVKSYNVNFDAQGGKINDSDTFTLNHQFYVPELESYIPSRPNYEFLGWYLNKEYTETVNQGDLLESDILLYAKWKPIQVISGQVTIDANVDNSSMTVDGDKLPTELKVVLQEITPGGMRDVFSQTVGITWNKNTNVGVSDVYRFADLDGDKEYRIFVVLKNFETSYQNESTALVDGVISDNYNEIDYNAVFISDPISTFVNVLLKSNPDTYWQDFEVDASEIGEGFRPSETLTEILYKYTYESEEQFKVVGKHTLSPYGILVSINQDGFSSSQYGEYVWVDLWDGTVYDYQLKLATVMINGTDFLSRSEVPFVIKYGDSSRWDAEAGSPTNTLIAKLSPKQYTVRFLLNTQDAVTGMEDYLDQYDHYTTKHTWSYATAIDAVPVRVGYKFIGWMDQNDNIITQIEPSVCSDIYLRAVWEKDESQNKPVTYTVEHIVDGVVMSEFTKKYTDYVWINAESSTVVASGALAAVDFNGYKFSGILGDFKEGDTVEDGTIISVLYAKDPDNTKVVGYTVRHVIGNDIRESQVYTDSVWVNDVYQLAVVEGSLDKKDYFGYKFDSIDIDVSEGDVVADGTVITIYYAPDRDVSVDINYYVNHCVDGIIKDTYKYTETVWVHDEKEITIVQGALDANEYNGYKFSHIDYNGEVGSKVENGKVITLYYDKDETVKKPVSYKVVHIADGEVVGSYLYSDLVWVNAPNMINIQSSSLSQMIIRGYRLDSISHQLQEGDAVESGTVITLYYVPQTYQYYVQHYYNDVLDESKTDVLSAEFGEQIIHCQPKNITGYNFERVDGLPLTIDTDESMNIIKIYYSMVVEPVEPSGDVLHTLYYSIVSAVVIALAIVRLLDKKRSRI